MMRVLVASFWLAVLGGLLGDLPLMAFGTVLFAGSALLMADTDE